MRFGKLVAWYSSISHLGPCIKHINAKKWSFFRFFIIFREFLPFSIRLGHPLVKCFLSSSYGTLVFPLGTLGGAWGRARAWKRPKNASHPQLVLCLPFNWVIPSYPIVKSSHSRIFHFYYSWQTRSPLRKPGVLGGPESLKAANKMP